MPPNRSLYKILYVQPYKKDGGPHQTLSALVGGLDRTRFDPLVLLPEGGLPADKFVQLGATVLFDAGIQTVPRSFSPRRQLEFASGLWRTARRVAQLINNEKIDIVHVNSEACWAGAVAARLARVPTIIHLHGLSVLSPPWVARITIGFLNHYSQSLIACSNAVKRAYLAKGAKPALMSVINNGINIDTFRPESVNPTLREELKISDGQPLIGMIANYDRRKGHHDFVATCAAVQGHLPNAQFVIVGDIDLDHMYYEEICRLISARGLDSAMHILGKRRDIPNILKSLDIVVQPSLTEAGPRVALEAMAMQRPLVVTDVGGNSEEVVDGETGLVVPVGNTQGLAAAVVKLLSDIPLGKEMGKCGRRRVLEDYTDELHARKVQQLYDRLLTELRRI